MSNQKILYITTEMFPYHEDSAMAARVHKMALKSHAEGNDVRVFMPKFGMISERKFQLHEVIRLSGMNVIINDLDQPLIIKVASLPGERLQVYFIDNDEYFKRKNMYLDEEGNAYQDVGERAIFFARGVIETIKKLNWVPDVIHVNGWMSVLVPVYIKEYYKNDLYFKNSKIVMSVYNEPVYALEQNIDEKFRFDKIKKLVSASVKDSRQLVGVVMNEVNVLVKGDEFLEENIAQVFNETTVKKYGFLDETSISQAY